MKHFISLLEHLLTVLYTTIDPPLLSADHIYCSCCWFIHSHVALIYSIICLAADRLCGDNLKLYSRTQFLQQLWADMATGENIKLCPH